MWTLHLTLFELCSGLASHFLPRIRVPAIYWSQPGCLPLFLVIVYFLWLVPRFSLKLTGFLCNKSRKIIPENLLSQFHFQQVQLRIARVRKSSHFRTTYVSRSFKVLCNKIWKTLCMTILIRSLSPSYSSSTSLLTLPGWRWVPISGLCFEASSKLKSAGIKRMKPFDFTSV